MKKDFMMVMVGILIGYCLVQGASYLNQNYFWALFYR